MISWSVLRRSGVIVWLLVAVTWSPVGWSSGPSSAQTLATPSFDQRPLTGDIVVLPSRDRVEALAAEVAAPRVRLVYLVPSDRTPQAHYVAALDEASRKLRNWFLEQLNVQRTFALDSPSVLVVRTGHEADWYRRTRNGNGSDFFFNVSEDGYALIGGQRSDRITMFYIDADPACGQSGGSAAVGTGVIAANDLRGLTGEPTIGICPNEAPDRLGKGRWIGGLGHELGHAFGLPHPPGCDRGLPSCDGLALMWAGYSLFPSTYLRPEEKVALQAHPAFVQALTLAPPFGSFDTPLDGEVVAGELPVTGWALDDGGVAAVSVYRDPMPGEPTQANGLVFIGNATFVRGARPDMARAHPSYPDSDRAGWGLMVLSNMLPHTRTRHQLSAFVKDYDDEIVLLGRRTIHLNNHASAAPFGTIDTPTQGATVSGVITNFGWVLTPQPNIIPLDGSSIDVIVDGVAIGHPTYNNARSDIATLFPGLRNSSGPVGYFALDTTRLTDGIHTIAWVARDDAGHATGLGSRYFEVKNSPITSLTIFTNRTDPGLFSATLTTGERLDVFGTKNDDGTPAAFSDLRMTSPAGVARTATYDRSSRLRTLSTPAQRLDFQWSATGDTVIASTSAAPPVIVPFDTTSTLALSSTEVPRASLASQAFSTIRVFDKDCRPATNALVTMEMSGNILSAAGTYPASELSPGVFRAALPTPDPNTAADIAALCADNFRLTNLQNATCDAIGTANKVKDGLCLAVAAATGLAGHPELSGLAMQECRVAIDMLNVGCTAIRAGPNVCQLVAKGIDRAVNSGVTLRPTAQFVGPGGSRFVAGARMENIAPAGPFPDFDIYHSSSSSCNTFNGQIVAQSTTGFGFEHKYTIDASLDLAGKALSLHFNLISRRLAPPYEENTVDGGFCTIPLTSSGNGQYAGTTHPCSFLNMRGSVELSQGPTGFTGSFRYQNVFATPYTDPRYAEDTGWAPFTLIR